MSGCHHSNSIEAKHGLNKGVEGVKFWIPWLIHVCLRVQLMGGVIVMVFNVTFNNVSYIVVVKFYGCGNWSTTAPIDEDTRTYLYWRQKKWNKNYICIENLNRQLVLCADLCFGVRKGSVEYMREVSRCRSIPKPSQNRFRDRGSQGESQGSFGD